MYLIQGTIIAVFLNILAQLKESRYSHTSQSIHCILNYISIHGHMSGNWLWYLPPIGKVDGSVLAEDAICLASCSSGYLAPPRS